MINVAVLGYGTIGSGVVEVLSRNKDSIAKRVGQPVQVKKVLDLRDFPGDPVEEILVHDYQEIVRDENIQIVVETMGGVHPAYEFVKTALESGRSVCSSNKELVAKHGAELIEVAREHRANFFFEASVGGGIPIIRPLNQSLTADEIEEITGILNGTTNFILTKMAKEGASYETVLKEAQELGYAERNPEADVEGYDACRKIAILTSLAYGMQVDYEDIYTEGITKITVEDFRYAESMNASIKLFATSRKAGDKVYAMVAPMMISGEHPLYSVNDVFNGVFVRGNVLGDAMFYGRGAGKLPTASAVVADVVDAAKHMGVHVPMIWSREKLTLADKGSSEQRFFVRLSGNTPEREAEVKGVFGQVETVSIGLDEYAFLTDSMTEAEFETKAGEISGLLNRIRVDF